MKLQIQTRISAVLPAAFAVVMGLTLAYTSHLADEARRQAETADAIASGIFELNTLTQEYALRGSARVVAQWRTRHDSLGRLLASANWPQKEDAHLLASLRRDHAEKGQLFAELTATPAGPWRDHLITQMRSKAQAVVSAAQQLEAQRFLEEEAVAQRGGAAVLGVAVAMAAVLALIQHLLSRSAIRCVGELTSGVRAFGAGNLAHRIPPGGITELDVVAASLNDMAHRLAESTTSIENLRRESTERERAEEAMRDLAAIVASANDAILRMTPDGRIELVNPAARQLYGYDTMQGRSVFDLVPPELRDEERQIIRRVVSGEHIKHYQTVRLRRDGTQVPVSLTVSPIHDAEGRVVAISKIARDITELKQVEEQLRSKSLYVRSLIEASLDPLVTISPEGKVTDVNEATIKVAGVPREQLVGSDFSNYFTEPDKAREGYRQVFATGFVTDYPLTIRHRDGHLIDVLYNASVYKDEAGAVLGVFAAARDVTDRKKAEDEILRLNAELEQRVIARTAELTATNKELEAFAYSVSHDLRAPLRAADGFARMVVDDYSTRLDDEGLRRLNVIRESTQKMGRLIDDLLAFSRMGRREMALADVDMTTLVRGVTEELRKLETARTIEVSIAPLPATHGDPSMIRQVWTNLLSNAIKFTRPRPVAHIEIGGHSNGDENIYSVKDDGVGFDMQYVGKLFGVFQRLHGPEEFEGTGVGLALVQRILDRHGGRIWAEAKVNEGATFSFALPNKAA